MSEEGSETVAAETRRFPCCGKERTHMVQSGCAAGDGEYTREMVTICEGCGQFRVSAMKNGVWTEVRFSLWNPDSLNAAHRPLERVRADEGDSVKVCEYQRQRDELSDEMERCHRRLDAHYGESTDTVALDTLEDRLAGLLSEVKTAAPSP